jgi:hypothetical protein
MAVVFETSIFVVMMVFIVLGSAGIAACITWALMRNRCSLQKMPSKPGTTRYTIFTDQEEIPVIDIETRNTAPPRKAKAASR